MIQSEYSKQYLVDLDSVMPTLIEYYVAFYGEKYRAMIEQKLRETVFVFCNGLEEEPFEPEGRVLPEDFNPMLTETTQSFITPFLEGLDQEDVRNISKQIQVSGLVSNSGSARTYFANDKDGQRRRFVCFVINDNTFDHVLIHELTHIIESAVIEQDNIQVNSSGLVWFGKNIDSIRRPEFYSKPAAGLYERHFNEVLTEYKAYLISSKFHEDGNVIFRPALPEDKFDLAYRNSWFVMEPMLKMLLPYANNAVLEQNKQSLIKVFEGEDNYYDFIRALYELDSQRTMTWVSEQLKGSKVDIKSGQDVFNNLDKLKKYAKKCDYVRNMLKLIDCTNFVEENIKNQQL